MREKKSKKILYILLFAIIAGALLLAARDIPAEKQQVEEVIEYSF